MRSTRKVSWNNFEGVVARKDWILETDAYVDRRIGEGATYAVIAGELGITAAAIAGRLYRRNRGTDPCRGQPRAAGALRTLRTKPRL
jgi:hypothetical protein